MKRRAADRCECGHLRSEHSRAEGCEGCIDHDPSWRCKCEAFTRDRAEKEHERAVARNLAEMATALVELQAQKLEAARQEREKLADLLEFGWGVIANAGGGNWTLETPEWQEAAARWRENWFATLRPAAALRVPPSCAPANEEKR